MIDPYRWYAAFGGAPIPHRAAATSKGAPSATCSGRPR